MVVMTLRIKVSPMNRAEIVKLIRPIIGPTEAHPGCLIFRLYSEMDDDDALLLLQEWRYQEDLDKFIRSRDFKRILAAMELASQTPEFCVNTVTSKSGWEFVEKLRLDLQAL